MCSAPSMPSAPKVVAPSPSPEQANKSAQASPQMMDDRRRAAMSKGTQSTILTGPMGAQNQAVTQKKTLLGQ